MDFDWISSLLDVSEEKKLIDKFSNKLSFIGIDNYAYFDFNFCSSPNIIGSYPDSWVEQYISNNYNEIDQTVTLCSVAKSPFTWSYAKKLSVHNEQKKFWNDAKDNNLDNGFSIPIFSSSQSTIGLGCCLSENNESKWLAKYMNEALILAHMFHSKRRDIVSSSDHTFLQYNISGRELECGKWLCVGFTLEQMAQKLSISERTVRFHLESLKKKLQVNNREQLIVKLITRNLITL